MTLDATLCDILAHPLKPCSVTFFEHDKNNFTVSVGYDDTVELNYESIDTQQAMRAVALCAVNKIPFYSL